MNGRLIWLLSMFGLAMGIATVYVIPAKIEPAFWIGIFVVCAAAIARNVSRRYFLHGFLVSLLNSVWITGAHALLFDKYIARHPNEASMLSNIAAGASPRLAMLAIGPAVGVLSGIILGLFSFVAGKLIGRAGTE